MRTNIFNLLLTTLISYLPNPIVADGMVEFIVNSSQAVHLEVSACANFRCHAHDELAKTIELDAGEPRYIQESAYQGQALEDIDMHFKVIEPETKEVLLLTKVTQPASNSWRAVKVPDLDFKLDIFVRNVCQKNYYGDRCGRYCMETEHWSCYSNGTRKCPDGYRGGDCSYPICIGNCSLRGICTAPNKCRCKVGYTGDQCETCVPHPGCIHGDCDGDQGYTCKCRSGYTGFLCENEACAGRCQNGATCARDDSSPLLYACLCKEGFTGDHCQYSISELQCQNKNPCKNGGTCSPLNSKTISCHCRPGYYGKFCEVESNDCGALQCPSHSPCHVIEGSPICVQEKAERKKTTVVHVDTTTTGKTGSEDNGSIFGPLVRAFLILSLIVIYCVYRKQIHHGARDAINNFFDAERRNAAFADARRNLLVLHEALLHHREQAQIHNPHNNASNSPPPAYSSLDLTVVNETDEPVDTEVEEFEEQEIETQL